jgi:hypothetical protein
LSKPDWWAELRGQEPPLTWQEKLLLALMVAESLVLVLWGGGAFRPLG